MNDYIYNDAIDYIAEKTGIKAGIIEEVLMAELDYMRSIGLVYDMEDEE